MGPDHGHTIARRQVFGMFLAEYVVGGHAYVFGPHPGLPGDFRQQGGSGLWSLTCGLQNSVALP